MVCIKLGEILQNLGVRHYIPGQTVRLLLAIQRPNINQSSTSLFQDLPQGLGCLKKLSKEVWTMAAYFARSFDTADDAAVT